MVKRIAFVLSFGGRFLTASFAYLGLGLALPWAISEPPPTLAQTNECDAGTPCPPGEICCEGTCEPDAESDPDDPE
jgi:hypothetical protein